MSKLWKVLGGICLVLVMIFSGEIGKLVGKTSVDNYYAGKKEGSIDEALLKTASKLNASLPMMVDADTRLDSTVGFSKNFRYNYTLIKYAAQDILNRTCFPGGSIL